MGGYTIKPMESEEEIDGVVAGVKAKLTADNVGDALKGLGGLFKK